MSKLYAKNTLSSGYQLDTGFVAFNAPYFSQVPPTHTKFSCFTHDSPWSALMAADVETLCTIEKAVVCYELEGSDLTPQHISMPSCQVTDINIRNIEKENRQLLRDMFGEHDHCD
ncbi:hypothetical protein [Pleionea sp. CnH1-48]|uniref:hypothetical protein n=1 Tax=Pleionea sp. CnH1-48 TaxID=2954494 RepID=UPI002096D79F|nr:hypothetical protein [Pleionea sp. CnH1-48]MCO7224182.1 hypothetical protein [Pleionea sp. CnH1-48]